MVIMKKVSLVLLSIAAMALSSCGYKIMDNGVTSMKSAKTCSYAPLWIAPISRDYADVNAIAEKNGITTINSVKQTVYPFVLFTKTCVEVSGK